MTTPLERITARIAPFWDADAGVYRPTPLLTLEEFFEGNHVTGSVMANVVLDGEPQDMPDPQQVCAVLEKLLSRDDVDDVRVAISMFDDPDWPFAEEVMVVTDVRPEQVRSWFPEAMAPDQVLPLPDRELEDIGWPTERIRVCWWD
ncbi:hypothetical protein CWT12_12595 [Actinomyces sp. 432]|uniref:hypothetical protein n=1 Tax=Actinomyces sp. 432 TaxID=2057798 RepID=UPI0013738E55|nr:hypothetical protein [Actinomyces sp. 432]QHO91983.1 hypothetical protein CWT12_12595 [Actinomyces sp. 432]